MPLLKPLDEREPGNRVAQRTHGELYQHIFVRKIEVMPENRLFQIVLSVDFKAEPDEKLLDRFHHAARFDIHGIQETVRIKVPENTPEFVEVRRH